MSQLLRSSLILDQQWTCVELSHENGIASCKFHAILAKELKLQKVTSIVIPTQPSGGSDEALHVNCNVAV
jgi:hypothetical protein